MQESCRWCYRWCIVVVVCAFSHISMTKYKAFIVAILAQSLKVECLSVLLWTPARVFVACWLHIPSLHFIPLIFKSRLTLISLQQMLCRWLGLRWRLLRPKRPLQIAASANFNSKIHANWRILSKTLWKRCVIQYHLFKDSQYVI